MSRADPGAGSGFSWPCQVHASQLKPSFMPLPCSQFIRGSLQPRRTGETLLMELLSPSLAGSAH